MNLSRVLDGRRQYRALGEFSPQFGFDEAGEIARTWFGELERGIRQDAETVTDACRTSGRQIREVSSGSYGGKFMRRIRSWKRGSERRSSNRGSVFRNSIHAARSW